MRRTLAHGWMSIADCSTVEEEHTNSLPLWNQCVNPLGKAPAQKHQPARKKNSSSKAAKNQVLGKPFVLLGPSVDKITKSTKRTKTWAEVAASNFSNKWTVGKRVMMTFISLVFLALVCMQFNLSVRNQQWIQQPSAVHSA